MPEAILASLSILTAIMLFTGLEYCIRPPAVGGTQEAQFLPIRTSRLVINVFISWLRFFVFRSQKENKMNEVN